MYLQQSAAELQSATDCHDISTQAKIHHFKDKISIGPGQTIAFSKASHSPKDYVPKRGAPDHQSSNWCGYGYSFVPEEDFLLALSLPTAEI